MAESTPNPSTNARLGLRRRAKREVPGDLATVVASIRGFDARADLDSLLEAFAVARSYHDGQRRLTGEPYITHPVEVARILADLGMPVPVLAAAILHDTVEDTGYSLPDLRERFGDEIATLVDGVTKLDKVQYGEHAQAETVRKMVVAMARDIRVLLIKLADRLHNMRTLEHMKPEAQARIVLALMDQRGIERADFVAHSYGASIVLQLLTMVFKPLDELRKEGESGMRKKDSARAWSGIVRREQ